MTTPEWFATITGLLGCITGCFALWKSFEANEIAREANEIEKRRIEREDAAKIPSINIDIKKASYRLNYNDIQFWIEADACNLGGKTVIKDVILNLFSQDIHVANFLDNTQLPCSIGQNEAKKFSMYFKLEDIQVRNVGTLIGEIKLSLTSGHAKSSISIPVSKN